MRKRRRNNKRKIRKTSEEEELGVRELPLLHNGNGNNGIGGSNDGDVIVQVTIEAAEAQPAKIGAEANHIEDVHEDV